MSQLEAPLLKALLTYGTGPLVPFHTPGHKQGKGLDPDLVQLLGIYAKADVSLMGDELDDPFSPHGCILEAQELLAALYESKESWFSAIGTTGALQILMMSSFKKGDYVFLPRNAHRSLWGGLVLTGATPIFLEPDFDSTWGIAHDISLKTLKEALSAYPQGKGLILVSPTYYGVAGNLRKLIEVAHQHHLIVLADEAHGPHLRFLSSSMEDALQAGADGVAQSAHKMLGAFTGASWFHLQGDRISSEQIRSSLLLLQTTSPNYPLLASLDGARRQLAKEGKTRWSGIEQLAKQLREEINHIEGLRCLTEKDVPGRALDPCKITVNLSGLGITGQQGATWLRNQWDIQPELTDERNVLFLLTYSDGIDEVDRLLNSLDHLSVEMREKHAFPFFQKDENQNPLRKFSKPKLTPRETFFSSKRSVPLMSAVGKIAGEIVSFYPPGIPLVWPGEVISEEVLQQILVGKKAGLTLAGPKDQNLEWIQTVEEIR